MLLKALFHLPKKTPEHLFQVEGLGLKGLGFDRIFVALDFWLLLCSGYFWASGFKDSGVCGSGHMAYWEFPK